jgi:hypothetical protein
VVGIEIERDQGTDHPVQPGEGQEQARCGDNRQSHEEHVFSSVSKTLKGKERARIGIGSVLRKALCVGPGKAKVSAS